MKVQVFIDGGNFYHLALKPLGIQPKDFDFDAFVEFLADSRAVTDMGKRYYVGTVREKEGDEKSKRSAAEQNRFFNQLKTTSWQIKTSKLRERTERIVIDGRVVGYQDILKKGVKEVILQRPREKGIDVKLAVDMLISAMDEKWDSAIIVSSDTDLMPAIDLVRHRFKRKIEYVGFSIPDPKGKGNDVRPTTALINRTDVQRVLVEGDIKRFVKPLE